MNQNLQSAKKISEEVSQLKDEEDRLGMTKERKKEREREREKERERGEREREKERERKEEVQQK